MGFRGYDHADNILSIADAITSGRSQTFTYDSLFRLKTAAAGGTYGSITYNYDGVGNRTSVADGAGTESYGTDSGSNRLQSVTLGSTTRSFTYDGAGNITADATGSTTYGLAYNKADRLSEVSLNGTPDTDYLYNALGERVKKAPAATPTAGTRFHYDRDGKLIAESDGSGTVIREYAWLDGLPIGEFTADPAGAAPAQVQVDNSDAGALATGVWTAATDGAGYLGSNYQRHEPGGATGGVTVDNSSAQFSTLGVWTTETAPPGFEGSNYRLRDHADGLADVVVDNGDASGFTTTGVWTSVSNSSGYNGSYLVHNANQISPEAVVVDNVDSGFQTFGTWSTSTATGRFGADFRFAPINQAAAGSVITDNDAANTSLTGTWSTSTASGRFGANFRTSAAGTGANSFTWTPSIAASKQYNVYAWWKSGTDRATNAPFTIYHDSGSTTVQVNQRLNGSKWVLLGTFALTPGQNHRVVLTNNADGLVVADAVMITATDALNRSVWTPTIPQADQYNVYAWWKSATDRPTDARYTIAHDSGATTVSVDQTAGGSQWNLLGSFPMSPGQSERITLTDQATTGTNVIADAVQVTRVGAPGPVATWAPTLPARDRYLVYARWRANAAHASDSPYVIFHESGSTTVRVNQKTNNATWVLLGTFMMTPGQGHRVELHDDANGQVAADAVKFVPEPVAKVATWAIAVSETGSYRVYAKWPALPSTGATDAEYKITHAAGTTPVQVNQKLNGGAWNLLGTFAFNAGGTGYKVELSDNTFGKVAADAIYYVRDDTAPSDLFTWTPTVPSAGAYQVYARWVANSGNTAAAQYTITHDAGPSTVSVNQKQNGGAWVLLGSHNFTPTAGQKISLSASNDGTTVADAVLFVGAGAQPANPLYVHADHLGSPQKMTDASQATVWDGVFNPFGEEVAITGLAAMPMRFPGQYADDETGFSYNYFRNYEPALGRYLQSDPVGLVAGVNTFAYTRDNPTSSIDVFGLASYFCTRPMRGDPTGMINHGYLCTTRPDGTHACAGITPDETTWTDWLDLEVPGKDSGETYNEKQCEQFDDDRDRCVENCLLDEFSKPMPRYGLTPWGDHNECFGWAKERQWSCIKQCHGGLTFE